LKLYLMKSGKEKPDNDFWAELKKKVNQDLKHTQSPLKKEKLLEKIIVFGKGVFDVAQYEKMLKTLRSTQSYHAALERRNEIFKEEMNLRQAYAGALLNKPADWWQNKMKEFESLEKGNSDEAAMYQRIRNFLSLNTYMLINRYIKQGNRLYAEQMLEIYKIIDPQNEAIPDLEEEINKIN